MRSDKKPPLITDAEFEVIGNVATERLREPFFAQPPAALAARAAKAVAVAVIMVPAAYLARAGANWLVAIIFH